MNSQTQEALIYIKNLEWALRHIKPSTRNVDQLAWDTIERTLAVRPASLEALEQPAWQKLTDDEIDSVWFEVVKENNFEGAGKYFARAIEQALKEKNNG